MRPSNVILAGSLVLGLFIAACGEEEPELPAPMPVKRPSTSAAVEGGDAGIAVAEYVYQYNPVGKRDPFRNPIGPGAISASSGRVLCNEPLCQWDLDQLTLVAVVTGDANPLAMVEDPTGRGHIVRRNTRIGKLDGRATQILRDSLIVTEYWVGPDGKQNPNPVTLRIKADVKEASPLDLLTGRPYP